MWAPSCGIKFSCAFRGGGGSAVLLCTDKEKIRGGSLLLLREREGEDQREGERESTLRRLRPCFTRPRRGRGAVRCDSLWGRGGAHTHTVGGGGGGGTLDDLDNPKCFSTGNLNTHPFAELNLQTRTGSCA